MAGSWKDKPSIFEFYVLPQHRTHGFELFEALLTASNARFMEIQSNDVLLTVMLHTYARDIWSEKRQTLQKAGLVPFAHILNGSIRDE